MSSRRFESAPQAIRNLQRSLADLSNLASRKGHSHSLFAQVFLDGDDVVVESPDGSEVARFTADGLTTGPLGVLGYAEVTGTQTGITSETDLTNLTVTVDVAASRRIRITGYTHLRSSVTADVVALRIKEATTVHSLQEETIASGTKTTLFKATRVFTPSEGSHTYKLSAARSSGTGSVELIANADRDAFILVEDIGPA